VVSPVFFFRPSGFSGPKEANLSIPLVSPAFSEGGSIPKRHAGDGDNLSPALSWSGSPPATKSFALLVEDPDAPSGMFVHWILFNIPPGVNRLPEGMPEKPDLPGIGLHGMNDAQTTGYFGPCPPPGRPHRYFFKVFALDRMLDLSSGCKYAQIQNALANHILDTGSVMGSYRR
jgi:Raf kinase inhibitor-like YbhB/YbcL family protein